MPSRRTFLKSVAATSVATAVSNRRIIGANFRQRALRRRVIVNDGDAPGGKRRLDPMRKQQVEPVIPAESFIVDSHTVQCAA